MHRTDTNQTEIVKFLRSIGASVLVLSQVGHGCPDILFGIKGQNYLLEIKSAKGDLTESQKEFFDSWGGRAYIVRSVDEVIDLLESLTSTTPPQAAGFVTAN